MPTLVSSIIGIPTRPLPSVVCPDQCRPSTHGPLRILQLVNKADKMLKKHRWNLKPHHVFFSAELPDLTIMSCDGKYEETIFTGEVDQVVTRLIETITSAHDFITTSHNAKTAFTTITHSSLKAWNLHHHHHHIKKTNILKEEPNYEEMQWKMIQATVPINKFILKHNESNSIPTPRLAKKVMKEAGKQKKTPVYIMQNSLMASTPTKTPLKTG